MKRNMKGLWFLLLIIATVLVFTGCGKNDKAKGESVAPAANKQSDSNTKPKEDKPVEVVTLKLADTFPTTHVMHGVTVDVFIKKMEESGKIKIEYFPAGQLGAPQDMLEMVKGGAVDIAYVSPGFISGSLPTSTVISLPNEFNNPEQGSLTLFNLANGMLGQEFDKQGVKPVFVSLTPFYEIFTSKKQVKLPEDIKGLKIRGGGGEADAALKLLKSSVVSLPSTEIYEAFQKGVIDGASISFASGEAYKIDEIAKYGTEGANLGSLATIHLFNKKKFDSLSAEVQKIIMDAGKAATIAAAKAWVVSDQKAKDKFVKLGGTIYSLTDAEKGIWKSGTKESSKKWIQSLTDKGIRNAQEVYDEMQKIKSELK